MDSSVAVVGGDLRGVVIAGGVVVGGDDEVGAVGNGDVREAFGAPGGEAEHGDCLAVLCPAACGEPVGESFADEHELGFGDWVLVPEHEAAGVEVLAPQGLDLPLVRAVAELWRLHDGAPV